MSALFPHWTPVADPVLEFTMNQVPFEGRNTATSVLPSPS
jgi:hypothetical protein